jgi:UDP-glucose 4-epimerase
MTILVTGGAGFIANTLVESILSRGDSVICLDNLCRGTTANVARFTEKNSFRFSTVDLADLDAFRSCLDSHVDLGQISEVWHLAANSDIPAGIADPGVDLRDTFMTTFNVLRLMEERKIGELLFASSSAIYGDLGEKELTESTGPLFPISNYGAMKLASEAMILAELCCFAFPTWSDCRRPTASFSTSSAACVRILTTSTCSATARSRSPICT